MTVICTTAIRHILDELEAQGKDTFTLGELYVLFEQVFTQAMEKAEQLYEDTVN